MDPFPFLSAEKEELILARLEQWPVILAEVWIRKRPPECPSEIVITEKRARRRKRIASVHRVISKKFKGRSVIAICSALGDDVDRGSCVTAIFGREIRCLKLYFLNKVDPDIVDLTRISSGIVIISAVDRKVIGDAAVAVYVYGVCRQIRIERIVGRGNRSRDYRKKLIVISAVQSQVIYLLIV